MLTENQKGFYWYILLTIRSLSLIGISTFKTIYDTFHTEQLIPIPPDEDSISNLESALHIPEAIESFNEYIEQNQIDDLGLEIP